jgi:hypothetical protein
MERRRRPTSRPAARFRRRHIAGSQAGSPQIKGEAALPRSAVSSFLPFYAPELRRLNVIIYAIPSLTPGATTLIIDPRLRSEPNLKIDYLNTVDHLSSNARAGAWRLVFALSYSSAEFGAR